MTSAYVTRNRIGRIATAFSLGVLSHVVLDAIPHSDYWSLSPSIVPWITLCEAVGICAIAGYVLRQRLTPNWPEYLLAGLVGSVAPDAKFFARSFPSSTIALSVQNYGDHFHGFFHADALSRPLLGTGIEITCTLLLLTILTVFPRTGPLN